MNNLVAELTCAEPCGGRSRRGSGRGAEVKEDIGACHDAVHTRRINSFEDGVRR